MKVLIVGGSGFIGTHLATSFLAAGHDVVLAGRSTSPAFDYTAPRPETWTRALQGCDLLINAVGILRERGAQTFDALHVAGPHALFTAAKAAGVKRIVQISALGADEGAVSRYHLSKREADLALQRLGLDAVVVQPSLVHGPGGASARMFETLASLPVIPVPGAGDQQVQPVHIDDLTALILRIAGMPDPPRQIAAVGPEPLGLRDFLRQLRAAMGLGHALILPVPRLFVSLGARVGDFIPAIPLDRETSAMLERGNTASPAPMQEILGKRARAVAQFLKPADRPAHALEAKLGWLTPLLRLSIAAMWFIAGIVSLGPYPVSASLQLLQQIGVPVTLAPVFLMGAVLLDLVLGVLALWPRAPRWIWSAQVALVAAYTLIITLRLPQLWLEPFGPVAKNLPILALLVLMQQLSGRK